MKTNSMAPEIQCPKCKHKWEVGADFELHVGSEVQCQGCGDMLFLREEEAVRYWTWGLVSTDKKAV